MPNICRTSGQSDLEWMRKRTSHDQRHAATDNAAADAPGVSGHSSDDNSGSDHSRSDQAKEQMIAIEQFRTNWTAMAERRAGGPVVQKGGEPALKWIQPAAQGAVVVTLGEGAWVENIELVLEPELPTASGLWLHIPYTTTELVSTSKITEPPGEAVFLIDFVPAGEAKSSVDARVRLANELAASVPIGVRAIAFIQNSEALLNSPHKLVTIAILLETPTGDYTGLHDDYPKLADLPGGFDDAIAAANQMQWETFPADLTD